MSTDDQSNIWKLVIRRSYIIVVETSHKKPRHKPIYHNSQQSNYFNESHTVLFTVLGEVYCTFSGKVHDNHPYHLLIRFLEIHPRTQNCTQKFIFEVKKLSSRVDLSPNYI